MIKKSSIPLNVKKLLFVLPIVTIILFTTGCATWEGIKEDTSNAYEATKDAIHQATE